MPFLKFSRDKRGYEHFYLVQPSSHRRGKSRPRVLYWFRTPPNVKVGREPFDDEVRRAIEAQNPGVTFDWVKLLETPIPPDIEHWRERRRAEKAARQVARAEAEAEEPAREPEAGTAVVAAATTENASVAVDAIEGTDARPHKRRRRRRRRGRGPKPDVPATPAAPEAPPDEPDSDV